MQYQFVLNILDSNTTNIVKDIIIFSTEDIQKNNTWSWKSADIAKTRSSFEKKIQNINPR